MTWFGWVMSVMFFLTLFSPETNNKARVISILLIFAILTVGTGDGIYE